jgi:acyl-CoA synthetase (AMP-forming)/AMP-acid ligase II
MPTTPIDALCLHATARPDATAFIHEDVVCTYYDLMIASERLACALLSRGVRHGGRVVLHMSNRLEMAYALYACFRIGAIACPMNLRYKTPELREMFQRLRPALYLGEERLYSMVEGIEPGILPTEKRFIAGPRESYKNAMPWSALSAGVVCRSVPPLNDKHMPAILLTTSGTTGEPKFVTHTPATLAATAELFTYSHLNQEQVVLISAPMVHGSGLITFLACVGFGAAVVLVERFDPNIVLDQIEAHGCTCVSGLPFMFHAVLEQQRSRPRKINSLRHCFCVGDVCPIQLQGDFEQSFGTPLRSVWGSTEASGALTYALRPGPVSRIVPGAQVRLVDEDGLMVPRGQVGELLVRGPEVAAGYWIEPGRIDKLATDDWFHRGDLMRQDASDCLWFVGRKKDVIVRGGSKISPIEIERVLLSHPLVRDAAVFGAPDTVLGQRVAAVVQLEDDGDDAAIDHILSATREQLADYKVPELLVAVDAVPRNPLGKIDREALAETVLGVPAHRDLHA